MRTFHREKTKRDVVVSVRIDIPLHGVLSRECESRGISLNSLINSILKRYLAWEKYSDELGFVPLYRGAVKGIFENLTEKAIKEIATEVGSNAPRDLTQLMFNKVDFDSVVSMIEITMSRFGVLRHEINDRNHTFIVHHGINVKFSQYLAEVMKAMSYDLSFGLCILDITKNALSMEIREFDGIDR
jgi:hypothetical protein